VSLNPNDIVPQLLHALTFDLKVFRPTNTSSNNKRGIRNKSKIIFPRKLKKKLIPKIGTIINIMKVYISKFLLALRK
jgi:hypothetical protein